MFSTFLMKQVNSFLADKNTCVTLCEFLNKVVIIIIIMINIYQIQAPNGIRTHNPP